MPWSCLKLNEENLVTPMEQQFVCVCVCALVVGRTRLVIYSIENQQVNELLRSFEHATTHCKDRLCYTIVYSSRRAAFIAVSR